MPSSEHQGISAAGTGAVGWGENACFFPPIIAATATTIITAAIIPRMPKRIPRVVSGISKVGRLASKRRANVARKSYRNLGWRNLRACSLREFRICSNSQRARMKQAPRQTIRMQRTSVSSDRVIKKARD